LVSLIVASTGSVVSFAYCLFFVDSLAWQIVYIVCLFAWVFASIFSLVSTTRGRVRSDEMSRHNEEEASSVAYRAAQTVLMIAVVLIVGFGMDIAISAPLLFGISFLLYAVQSGFYLFLEKEGIKADAKADH